MDRLFGERQSALVRSAFERGLGCDLPLDGREELTLVERPDSALWPYIVMAATFGPGMLISVDAAYRTFAESADLEKPEAAAWPEYLGLFAAEAARRGTEAIVAPLGLRFSLAVEPPEAPPAVPDGLELQRLDPTWMLEELSSGRFPNALGSSGERARAERNRFAFALVDAGSEPIALAGVFDTLGLFEIGIDVVPAAQGRGLAPLLVTAAARAILDVGETPLYGCTATNVRSQRTALASGFRPVGADAYVR